MRVFAVVVMTFISGALLGGCSSVEGVDEYQGALHLGCKPLPTGGLVCSGDRG